MKTPRIPEKMWRRIHSLMPIVCVDLVISHKAHPERFLLIKRKREPEAGKWFLPGGRIFRMESAEEAALRIAKDECGLTVTEPAFLGYDEGMYSESPFAGGHGTHTVQLVIAVHAWRGRARLDANHSAMTWRRLAGIEADTRDCPHYVKKWVARAERRLAHAY